MAYILCLARVVSNKWWKAVLPRISTKQPIRRRHFRAGPSLRARGRVLRANARRQSLRCRCGLVSALRVTPPSRTIYRLPADEGGASGPYEAAWQIGCLAQGPAPPPATKQRFAARPMEGIKPAPPDTWAIRADRGTIRWPSNRNLLSPARSACNRSAAGRGSAGANARSMGCRRLSSTRRSSIRPGWSGDTSRGTGVPGRLPVS